MNRDSLPQQMDRIAADFTGLDEGEKQTLLAHLRGQPDAAALDRTVTQIIHNGGPKAELVGRIFQRNVANPLKEGQVAEGQRTVSNKPLAPIQQAPGAEGTGGPPDGSIPHEEPHTSRANPPVPGHPVTKVVAPGTDSTEPSATRRSVDEAAGH